MDRKYIPTEHLTQHSAIDGHTITSNQAQLLEQSLRERAGREATLTQFPSLDIQHRFVGICANKGNLVFTDTPVEAPDYNMSRSTCSFTYQRPMQHPMYKTSNGQYGRKPWLSNTPIVFFPRDQEFSTRQAVGGVYEDTHLTTEMDKKIIDDVTHKSQ
ncbi:uncharacterized protein LOC131955598 [Physella acuta]|uniref:uncharacterized protein LOC131955598 n=1 Tax=Physella acuta TaxID=109671 RepID=UPI0027DDAAF5|nr:uncharacterized protein LOC131955598 [Physella acuta]XP_059175758.1 uncharacterized protein LOC131955598 [Physella acuta]